ncbi:phenol hydroxylase P3 protein [Panacagrimonas perspica]|uniref:Phenol hydroxylase P3 protein n=1 Tax=Panacagrimonas perspica TaxID=381431 RepID=A0A4S3K5I3_9GAMM|nr:YHS domain-containing protein [Panacagrimonas perspica]TDU28525.1 phenol hydroxylase P3 protein [Panacagrimonas perspica]THD03383.1 phenol 2-monooxygenase [Panacagrimonas perspica]
MAADGNTKPPKKLSLKENYAMLTRGLDWEPTYEKKEDIFQKIDFEGIKIHDWDKWEDPFRLTMDAYWKYQGEKERKLYAIIDAFQQGNGQFNVTDARYVQALKVFLNGIVELEYASHRGFCMLGREFPGAGPRIAAQMQSIDELRHATTQIHAISQYNKYFEGMENFPYQFDRVWYLSIPKSFFEDACTSGPFEFIVAISFAFEYVLTNLAFMPWMSGAAFNGDMSTVSFGFSAQSDEARHMTLGIEVIKFLLEQDPANVALVQKWIDKWFWRGYRLLALLATMMDYILPKRVMSWGEAWTIYYEENGGALFADLARYGIKPPKYADVTIKEKGRVSHEMWSVFYANRNALGFGIWLPSEEEMDWFSEKYPDTFDKYYRPRYEYWRQLEAEGKPFTCKVLPQLCQTCQWPCLYTEADDATEFVHRESDYKGEIFHFCSDGCKDIFDDEPEKFVHAWMPVNQIYQGNCFLPGVDPTAPDFNPMAEALKFMGLKPGVDGGLFKEHLDAKRWEQWTSRPANIHEGAYTDSVRSTETPTPRAKP